MIGEFALDQLVLDGLPQSQLVNILQNKDRFDDFPEGVQRLIHGILSLIGIQSPEDVGGGVFLELDGGHKTQKVVPVVANDSSIYGLVRSDNSAGRGLLFWFEYMQGLLADALDARCKEKLQQMGQPEDSFRAPMGVCGMDIA